MKHKNIYDLITSEESAYQTIPVQISENYEWNMYEHISTTINYKNSKYTKGSNDGSRPYKNIIRPILNLAYRAEGFDVKDIELFVNDKDDYYKSFLVKKYHEPWARKNNIDTFIDETVESYVDFGGTLVKNVNKERPEVVPLESIAFCDQTDMLSGPFALKHFYSPDQLKEMESSGWKNIDEVIRLSENEKQAVLTGEQKTKTPGKYIEVYEIHGVFPTSWLSSGDDQYDGDETFSRQLHICTFYKDENSQKTGISLYKGKERELPFKLLLRDKVYGRALGMGGAEELFQPQVWANYGAIRVKDMLDSSSKTIYQTSDASFANRNKTSNLENGEILVVEEGKNIAQINTQPVNVVVFENSIREWENHARQMGAATESIMGESPSAGTPFALQQLITAESHSLHEYRKGKIATFISEVYRDWIIPYISKEVSKGQEFLSDLDADELQQIAESMVICETNKMLVDRVLSGKPVLQEDIEVFKDSVRAEFAKGGSKKFIEIFKEEMKDAPMDVFVNIVGKQKNMAGMTDKLTNIFRQILAAPAVLDDPRMTKIFNQILESSGLSPIDFYSPKTQQVQAPVQPQVAQANGIQ